MPYDLSEAFEAIENELIGSMMRNLKRHRAEETMRGFEWEQWQALQLRALEEYRRRNAEKFPPRFSKLNGQIDAMLKGSYRNGGTEQERKILQAIRRGFKGKGRNKPPFTGQLTAEGSFFGVNDRKLGSLIEATVHDMERAEYAVLRRAEDAYRQTIFNAHVYANTGSGTYEKAVDMATRDFLRAGLACVEYQNGSRHTLSDYADMAIRTANKRAYLQGEGAMRQEWNIPTVIMNKRSCPCPKCAPFVGMVFIDDVWSGGQQDGTSPVTGAKYPLLSEAIAQGLYHPRCKDSHSTYFEGISTPPGDSAYTAEELDTLAQRYDAEQKQGYCRRQQQRYARLSRFSLDPDNQRMYGARAKAWGLREGQYRQLVHSLAGSGNISPEVVANAGGSGIIEKRQFNSKNDPMYEVTGSAFDSNPKELQLMIDTLKEWGVEINYGSNTLGYGCTRLGRPGILSITQEASYSAWSHEFQHIKDDREAGWNGLEVLWNDRLERERREQRAYAIEISLAKKAGRLDIVERLEANLNEELENIRRSFEKHS